MRTAVRRSDRPPFQVVLAFNWQAREWTSRESVRDNADVRHNRSTPEEVVIPQHLRDLAWLRRVRDRIDREYAQPLDVEALARGAHMSAGHLSREFRLAYGESPYAYLMTRRIERAMALLRRGDSASPTSVSRSAARPWAPSAVASPTWSVCRPASIGARRLARRRGCRRASRSR